MSKRGFSNNCCWLSRLAPRLDLVAPFWAALVFGACSSNSLHLPTMPWTAAKAVAATPSPYAPVPVDQPALPPAAKDTSQYGDSLNSVVATVDGNPITQFDIQNPDARATNPLAGKIPTSGTDPESTLKQLIAQQLLDRESDKYASRVEDGDVDRFIQEIEDRNHITDAQLRAQLQAEGTSYEAFRKSAFKQVETIEMVQHEVRQKIEIPDSEIGAYYKNHPEEFTITQEKYQLAQILIAVPADAPPDKIAAAQKKADEVRNMAIKGKDFGELARQYSDDDSKTKGGELGQFKPDDLNDQIADAVKQTKTGDIAPLVHTHYGFHVVKVEEHQEPGEQPLAAVKDLIHDKLVNDQAKDRFERWVEQDLAKQHDIQTLN
jgi:peptidyl-prolyl cis-trans isomerase SurA